jgi:hypothetical protein
VVPHCFPLNFEGYRDISRLPWNQALASYVAGLGLDAGSDHRLYATRALLTTSAHLPKW